MILIDNQWQRSYQNPIGRWASVGPYYAMFPNEFAFDVIHRFTNPGDRVLDPFAGRFSSIYASTAQGRDGTGIEINPVGWVYGQAKLHPAAQDDVELRLKEICRRSRWFGFRSKKKLPEFFSYCYSEKVLSFLLTARHDLDWHNNSVDTTLMSLILIVLHAKLGSGLSNQMRQSKAMAPDYSIKWWKDNRLEIPPDIDPQSFMLKKIGWRYQQGVPIDTGNGEALLADSTVKLADLKSEIENDGKARFKLLLTSPPYYDITHYHYDQWLRLWMLGGPHWPSKAEDKHRGRFSSQSGYRELLDSVFRQAADVMTADGVVYIRTDKRKFTLETTRSILQRHFSGWAIEEMDQPFPENTQTALYGDFTRKPGEVDIILRHQA